MRIGIANDVPMMVEALRRVLARCPQHELIWIAQDGEQAVEMCAWQLPDVVLMDLIMPKMNGAEATRAIMQRTPCAILLVTADINAHPDLVYQALGHGALDVTQTPAMSNAHQPLDAQALLARIAQIGDMLHKQARHAASPSQARPVALAADSSTRLVAIGTSAGGPAALATLLGELPKNFSAAIVVVQHIDAMFADGMATWLQQQCRLNVAVAQEGDIPQPGTVLLAGTNQHLLLKNRTTLGYVAASPKDIYHPSIDVFFQSLVAHWRGEAIGLLLTGMGRDGAVGLKAMHEHGYHTIVQDRQTCTVYGMPKAAISLQAASETLPISSMATRLLTLLEPGNRKNG